VKGCAVEMLSGARPAVPAAAEGGPYQNAGLVGAALRGGPAAGTAGRTAVIPVPLPDSPCPAGDCVPYAGRLG